MLRNFVKITVFLLACSLICGCSSQTRVKTLERVAVTGASVTAGWGLKTPPIKGDFGGYPISLKHIVDAMILTPHEEVAYFGNRMFFARPVAYGKELVDEITTYDPTLIIAIDFLFWYAYGNVGVDGEEHRIARFKEGLSILEKIQSPLIVGDIPDVHKAIGKVLSASYVPTVETIQKVNHLLRSWAKMHPNVTVVDIHTLFMALLDDMSVATHLYTWPAGSQERLLQRDMLHTTFEGTVALSLVVADLIDIEGLESNPKVLMKNAAALARAAAK
jgi:hypothetical protein